MKNSFLCVIPARLQSTRFPRKVLYNIKGLPMLVHVYKRAQEANCFDKIIVATDSQEVQHVCSQYNIESMLTSNKHQSGFDRIVEVADIENNFSHYLNLQGDEPCVNPQTILGVINFFNTNSQAKIVSSATAFKNKVDFKNPNQVKVVLNDEQKALYFSRASVPYFRDSELEEKLNQKQKVYKHQGIYAYEKNILKELSRLTPSSLEETEKLEQLRFLQAGYSIYISISDYDSSGVDTPDDIEKVLNYL